MQTIKERGDKASQGRRKKGRRMNNICIMGRLTADPAIKKTVNGTSVLKFSVAVKRPHSKNMTDFISCVAWHSTAEFIEKYFHKGKMIAITGIMASRSWKDEENKNKSVMELLVENAEFCGDKEKQDNTPAGFSNTEEEPPF